MPSFLDEALARIHDAEEAERQRLLNVKRPPSEYRCPDCKGTGLAPEGGACDERGMCRPCNGTGFREAW